MCQHTLILHQDHQKLLDKLLALRGELLSSKIVKAIGSNSTIASQITIHGYTEEKQLDISYKRWYLHYCTLSLRKQIAFKNSFYLNTLDGLGF